MSLATIPTPEPIHGTTDVVSVLRSAIGALDERRAELAEAGDWESLAWAMSNLRAVAGDLRDLSRAVEDDVAELLPSRRETIEGLGTLERHRSTTRRSWDWDSLLPALVRLTVDPEGTGELPAPAELIAALSDLIREVIGVTPSKGPRITALRELGLQPDEWCEATPGRETVQITGGQR